MAQQENPVRNSNNALMYADSMLTIADRHLANVLDLCDSENVSKDPDFDSDSLERLHDSLGEIASKLVAIEDSIKAHKD